MRAQVKRARQPASPNDWIEDSRARNGSRIRVSHSSAARVDIELECRPRAWGAVPGKSCSQAPHYHIVAFEWLTVRRGTLGISIDGIEQTVTAENGTIAVHRTARHYIWNAAQDADLEVQLTLSPARNAEQLYRTVYGLAYDYGSPAAVPLLQSVVTHAAADMPLAAVPPVVWRLLVKTVVVFVARLAGYRAFEEDYKVFTGVS